MTSRSYRGQLPSCCLQQTFCAVVDGSLICETEDGTCEIVQMGPLCTSALAVNRLYSCNAVVRKNETVSADLLRTTFLAALPVRTPVLLTRIASRKPEGRQWLTAIATAYVQHFESSSAYLTLQIPTDSVRAAIVRPLTDSRPVQ